MKSNRRLKLKRVRLAFAQRQLMRRQIRRALKKVHLIFKPKKPQVKLIRRYQPLRKQDKKLILIRSIINYIQNSSRPKHVVDKIFKWAASSVQHLGGGLEWNFIPMPDPRKNRNNISVISIINNKKRYAYIHKKTFNFKAINGINFISNNIAKHSHFQKSLPASKLVKYIYEKLRMSTSTRRIIYLFFHILQILLMRMRLAPYYSTVFMLLFYNLVVVDNQICTNKFRVVAPFSQVKLPYFIYLQFSLLSIGIKGCLDSITGFESVKSHIHLSNWQAINILQSIYTGEIIILPRILPLFVQIARFHLKVPLSRLGKKRLFHWHYSDTIMYMYRSQVLGFLNYYG